MGCGGIFHFHPYVNAVRRIVHSYKLVNCVVYLICVHLGLEYYGTDEHLVCQSRFSLREFHG